MLRSKRVWFFRLMFYAVLIAGCVLAFAPANQTLHAQFNDKLLHAVGFFCIAISAHFAHPNAKAVFPVMGLALFGLMIEVVQAYLPYRSFSWADWVADLVGIFLYYYIAARLITVPLFRRYKYGQY